MGVISYIVSILKGLIEIKPILDILKQHKGKGFLIIICLGIVGVLYNLMIDFHKHTSKHNITTNDNQLEKMIDKELRLCGDKSAISVSSVAIIKKGDYWVGSFKIARACDAMQKGCILDLKPTKPQFYLEEQLIRSNTYNLLLDIGLNNFSTKFSLRNEKNAQDLNILAPWPSLKKLVEKTEWAQQGILHNLLITSIVSKDESVLYVITFLAGKDRRELSCIDQDNIINNIKKFIIEN